MRSRTRREAFLFLSFLAVATAQPALAGCGASETVTFSLQQETTLGESVFVLGDLAQLGSWDPAEAIKLEPTDYPTWKASVALPAGTSYAYKFVLREDGPDAIGDPTNVVYEPGPDRTGATDPDPDPATGGKTVHYISGWDAPRLVHREPDGSTGGTLMLADGPGRAPGEMRWLATDVSDVCETLDFAFHDGAGDRDLSPWGGPYAGSLGTFWVQDGHVYDYPPSPSPGPSRIETIPQFPSLWLGNTRDIFVYLPRGYDASPERRYPVVYMHDGQNLFDRFAPWGGWRADTTADRLIGLAAVDEHIIVGVANTFDRLSEYLPPEDGGTADLYGRFLVDELKPWIDATYRTRPERDATSTLGSSMGGLVSVYLAWEYDATFGSAASLSGSFQFGGILERIATEPPRDVRIYVDSGTGGFGNDNFEENVAARDTLLARGYVLYDDLEYHVAVGAQHNEAAWADRLELPLRYLLGSDR